MRSSISFSLLICAANLTVAGPVEYGLAQFNAAVAARHLRLKAKTELSLDPPETYRIEPYTVGGARISGGDIRGLMYGLLEAAEQIGSTGRLARAQGVPAIPVRGIRILLHCSDLDKPVYSSEEFWRAYFQMLARDRFNRFTLIFLTDSLAPPYPFFLDVKGFPEIGVPGLEPDQRDRNLRALRLISQTAAEYAIDFTLGIWERSAEPDAASAVQGLTAANIGPYSHDALSQLLADCPMIRSVQIQGASGFPGDYVFKALREAGRRVTLDPRGSLREPELLKAAEEDGVALHFSHAAWPRGFEIDPPIDLSQQAAEAHPLFYWLWGRLSYDPQTKTPKGENAEEYRAANRLIHLLADADLADPNLYIWPLANPGGWADDYSDDQPRDWGSVATIPEAVRNRFDGVASAKQTPLETASLLIASAGALDRASQPDFRLLAQLARYHAYKLRAAYNIELFDQTRDGAALDRAEQEIENALSGWETAEKAMGDAEGVQADLPDVRLELERIARSRKDRVSSVRPVPALAKPLPRPQFAHTPIKASPPQQSLTLTLQITPLNDVRVARLHYRTENPADPVKTIEKPVAAAVTFTIPASDIPSNSDLLYYFEVINREKSGWFEPDPLSAPGPYHTVRIH